MYESHICRKKHNVIISNKTIIYDIEVAAFDDNLFSFFDLLVPVAVRVFAVDLAMKF